MQNGQNLWQSLTYTPQKSYLIELYKRELFDIIRMVCKRYMYREREADQHGGWAAAFPAPISHLKAPFQWEDGAESHQESSEVMDCNNCSPVCVDSQATPWKQMRMQCALSGESGEIATYMWEFNVNVPGLFLWY